MEGETHPVRSVYLCERSKPLRMSTRLAEFTPIPKVTVGRFCALFAVTLTDRRSPQNGSKMVPVCGVTRVTSTLLIMLEKQK